MFQLHTYHKSSKMPQIKEYVRFGVAKFHGVSHLKKDWNNWLYEIVGNGEVVFAALHNYNPPIVLRDFKSYANCVRPEIGRDEMERESFMWFNHHGYIEYYGTSPGVAGGLWILTDKFREVGKIVHNGGLPPEFERIENVQKKN